MVNGVDELEVGTDQAENLEVESVRAQRSILASRLGVDVSPGLHRTLERI